MPLGFSRPRGKKEPVAGWPLLVCPATRGKSGLVFPATRGNSGLVCPATRGKSGLVCPATRVKSGLCWTFTNGNADASKSGVWAISTCELKKNRTQQQKIAKLLPTIKAISISSGVAHPFKLKTYLGNLVSNGGRSYWFPRKFWKLGKILCFGTEMPGRGDTTT